MLRLRQAKAAYEEANANYERIAVLHEQRMVSQTEYETTRLRFANARLGLEEVQLNLDHTDLEAPISGVITQRLVEVGDLVRNNQEVFVIADLDPLLVRIFIPERRMYQLHPGQEATITVEALPERSFHGKIRMISPEVDPESGTVKATLEVEKASREAAGNSGATALLCSDSANHELVAGTKPAVGTTRVVPEEAEARAPDSGGVLSALGGAPQNAAS